MKPLTLGLVFHFNQNTVPMAYIANQVCYKKLLTTFLDHPKCQFTIHFSGTLLSALQWEDGGTLELLQKGVEQRQIELLGSSYAQNILLATNEWDNVQQLRIHREQLKKIFGVAPTGFWNAERCWDQKLAGLILDAGYEYTFLETNVFRRVGDENHQSIIRATEDQGRRLVLFNDDTNVLSLFGKAVRTGSADEFIEYLYNLWLLQNQTGQDFTVIYAQDAEATGLWQFEGGGQSLSDLYAKLAQLLAKLEKLPWLKVGGLQEKAQKCEPLVYTELPQGQANWMIDSLRSENLPWGETGYSSWFEYAEKAPKNILTRELYTLVRKELQTHGEKLEALDQFHPNYRSSKALYDLAVRTLIAHQYEFGCIGIAVDKEAQWQLARTALVVLWASKEALKPREEAILTEDLNHDGIPEISVVTKDYAYVFSQKGGRLLYWFDLKKGIQLVGNQNTRYYLEQYRDDNSYTPYLKIGRELFPQFSGRTELGNMQERSFLIRPRCLNDFVSYADGREIAFTDFFFQVSKQADGQGLQLTFSYAGELFAYEKIIEFGGDGLTVNYLWDKYPDNTEIAFVVRNEVHPDYNEILDLGQACLNVVEEQGKITVENTKTDCKTEVGLAFPKGQGSLAVEPVFLAFLVEAEFALKSDEQDKRSIGFTVRLSS